MIQTRLTCRQRFGIPTYLDPAEITTGEVEFDGATCTRCGICATCCPVGSIVVRRGDRDGPAPHVLAGGPDVYLCFACGNCVASCPTRAVTLKRRYTTHLRYNRLWREPTLTFPKRY